MGDSLQDAFLAQWAKYRSEPNAVTVDDYVDLGHLEVTDDDSFDPLDHQPIGRCTVCNGLVYPATPEEVDARPPVMHEECGW